VELKNSVRYAETATLKKPITSYLRTSPQAEAYRRLAEEILKYD